MKVLENENIDFYKNLVKDITKIIKTKYDPDVKKEDISFAVAQMFESKNFADLSEKVKKNISLHEKTLYPVYVQYWDESESGWGTRSDGISVHNNMEDAKLFVKSEMEKQKKQNMGFGTPETYYINRGEPVVKFINKEQHTNLLEKGYIRTYKNNPDWLFESI